METNAKLSRRNLSLGNRINSRRSNTQIQKHFGFQVTEENNETGIQDSKIISDNNSFVNAESTPPRKKYSLDESIEYSPGFLNFSLSPGSLYSQTVGSNSEVSWQWSKSNNSRNEHSTSYVAPADNNILSAESKVKDFVRCAKSKREEHLRAIEYKIRRAENLRVDEKFKGYCAIFKEKLCNAESQVQKDNIIENEALDDTSNNSGNIRQTETIKSNSAADFFDDSIEDDFLLEATEKVEHEFIRHTQNSAVVETELSTENNSNKNNMERRTSMYSKFFEDDAQDDLFGSFDDIIEQAMQTSKPRASFQRHNSLPTESMSPKSKPMELPKEVPITSRAQQTSSALNTTIKRHASSQDVPIYHPYKIKQIKRR